MRRSTVAGCKAAFVWFCGSDPPRSLAKANRGRPYGRAGRQMDVKHIQPVIQASRKYRTIQSADGTIGGRENARTSTVISEVPPNAVP
jgi:hypothetical protein